MIYDQVIKIEKIRKSNIFLGGAFDHPGGA